MLDARQRTRGITRRGRTDYRMARRALLLEVTEGIRTPEDVCDAHPDLRRAGRNIGDVIDADCPVCTSGDSLRMVTYGFYGRGPTRSSGRALSRGALGELTKRYGDVAVYNVEVCFACGWHHLLESYWLGRRGAAVS